MMIPKSIIKRHLFFIFSCFIVLTALFFLGYGLSRSVTSTAVFSQLPQKNDVFLLLCRTTVYSTVFFLWKPFFVAKARIASNSIHSQRLHTLIAYRYKFMVMIILYEAFIVQNIMGTLMSGF